MHTCSRTESPFEPVAGFAFISCHTQLYSCSCRVTTRRRHSRGCQYSTVREKCSSGLQRGLRALDRRESQKDISRSSVDPASLLDCRLCLPLAQSEWTAVRETSQRLVLPYRTIPDVSSSPRGETHKTLPTTARATRFSYASLP